jgi:energy-coupling factor transporter ATP-binding protein EcfA2
MLVRFFGSNFRSLKGKFELSMVAADLKRKEDRDRGVIEVTLDGLQDPLRLLRCVAIYGANASGKSTIIAAAESLRWLVVESSPRSCADAVLPSYQPFLLDSDSRSSELELGCDVVCNDSLLRYCITFNAIAIQREALTLLGTDGETKLIDRGPLDEISGELIERSEANRLYVKQMQSNVAVLSKLAQHGPQKGQESVQEYFNAIRNALKCKNYTHVMNRSSGGGRFISGTDEGRFVDDPDYREWILHHLMRPADVGICDVKEQRERMKLSNEVKVVLEKTGAGVKIPEMVTVSFVHEGSMQQPISFVLESVGTKKLFFIGPDWWSLAKEQVTLFADELSAGLHPRLLDRLIRAVNDAPASQRSQLIFTTHDTGLLESLDGQPPALRRDQVYLTKKDAQGATELYSLAEFKEEARPVHNIRKRYMSGLYGAIPSVEKLSL